MKKGLLTTLLAVAASVSGITAVHANAPTISPLPDVTVGDSEDNGVSDNNYFVYTNAFNLDQKANDDLTADNALLWSFVEASSPQRYAVTGRNPIGFAGDTGLEAKYLRPDLVPNSEAPAAAPSGGVKNIRSLSDWASFRDIIMTPGDGSLVAPFPTVTPDNSAGEVLTFFVSDGTGATSDSILVKTIDNGSDSISGGAQYTVKVDNQFGAATGWIQEGTTRAGIATTAFDAAATALKTFVSTNPGTGLSIDQQYRIIGWREQDRADLPGVSTELKYADVGATNWVRAKFKVFATGQTNAAAKNQIPNMRMRISGQAYSFASLLDLQHHVSNNATLDPIAQDMAPGNTEATAATYRVDMDPPELAAYTSDSNNKGFARLFEAYAQSGEPQENGYLLLADSQIGTYPAPAGGTVIKTYDADEFDSAAVGTASGTINQTVGVIYAYSATLTIESATLNGGAYGTYPVTPTSQINWSVADGGITISTEGVDTLGAKIAIAQADWNQGATEDTNTALRARVEPAKQYRVKFNLGSTVASSVQAQVRLRASSMQFLYNPRLEVGGSQGSNQVWTHQYLPGTGGWNGPTNTHDLIFVSPFAINPAQMGLTTGSHLGATPGPGTASAAGVPQPRDIMMGLDLLDEFINPTTAKGRVTIKGVTIESFDLIPD